MPLTRERLFFLFFPFFCLRRDVCTVVPSQPVRPRILVTPRPFDTYSTGSPFYNEFTVPFLFFPLYIPLLGAFPDPRETERCTHTHDLTISESGRMVTVSFDFSQIPAQWVARNSCGKKVVKSVGRGARRVSSSRRGRFEKFHPGQGGEDWFFSSKSAFPFATFLTFSRNRGGRKLLLGTILAGNSVCWRGKEDFGRGINKYVNIFPVEKDSSKEDSFWIEDQRGATLIVSRHVSYGTRFFLFLFPPRRGEKAAIQGL